MASIEERLQHKQSPQLSALTTVGQTVLPASLMLQPDPSKFRVPTPNNCMVCSFSRARCVCPKGSGDDDDDTANDSRDLDNSGLMTLERDVPSPDPGLGLADELNEDIQAVNIDALALNSELTPEELEQNFEFKLDESTGSLSIALRPGSALDPEQIANYFKGLDQHFLAFQQDLTAKNDGQVVEGFSRVQNGNTITYTIPAGHYPAYLQSLVNKGFAPASILDNLNQAALQQANTTNPASFFAPSNSSPTLFAASPFKMIPMPGMGGTPAKRDDDENKNSPACAA